LLYTNECAIIKKKEVTPVEQKVYPVDVISVCSAAGEIRPLRLRMEDENHQLLRIDIDEVVSIKKIQYVGIEAHISCAALPLRDRNGSLS
jgi:hypothetical protein